MDRCDITDENGNRCQLGAGHDGSHMTEDGTPFYGPDPDEGGSGNP